MSEEREPASEAAQDFVLEFGRALHRFGASAFRLENAMELLCHRFGLKGQFFSTPTAIVTGFGAGTGQNTYLTRAEPGEVNLEKLSLLHTLFNEISAGGTSLEEAGFQLDHILKAPPRRHAPLTLLAFAGASASAARFLQGGWREILVAASIGLWVGLMSLAVQRSGSLARVFTLLAAIAASLLAGAAAWVAGPLAVFLATLAGVIVLVPGLTLTVAITELSTRHLVSGTARLTGAFVLFLNIGFGVALGGHLATLLFGAVEPSQPAPLPGWTEPLGALVAPLCFAVLLRAAPGDAGWALLGGLVAYAGARGGGAVFGPELGMFFGTLALGILSNLSARYGGPPAAVPYVPGRKLSMILRHPGFSFSEYPAPAGLPAGVC